MRSIQKKITILLIVISCSAFAKTIKTLYLEDAVAIALAHSPVVEVSNLQRVVDKFSLRLAYNNYSPQLSLSAAATNSDQNTYLINPAISWKTEFGLDVLAVYNATQDDNKSSLSFDMPLIRGSGNINTIPLDNALDQEEINRLNYRDSVASVINQVQAQYFQVLSFQKQIEVLKLSLTRSENTLKEYKLKVSAGDMPESNIPQQEAQITNDKLQFQSNNAAMQIAQRKLMVMLGLPPQTKYKIDSEFEPSEIALPSIDNAIKQAKKGNYSYQQKIISLRALKRSLEKADDEARIKLNLNGKIDSDGERTAAITASIPINNMSTDYNIVAAKTSIQQAEINLKQAEYDLVSEVTNMIENLVTKRKQIELAKNNIKYAKQNYENAKISHKYGKSSAYEVVSQMQQYLQSEISLIDYKISFYTTYAELNKFLGLTLDKWQVKLVM
jgi:outer membrane protein TolC